MPRTNKRTLGEQLQAAAEASPVLTTVDPKCAEAGVTQENWDRSTELSTYFLGAVAGDEFPVHENTLHTNGKVQTQQLAQEVATFIEARLKSLDPEKGDAPPCIGCVGKILWIAGLYLAQRAKTDPFDFITDLHFASLNACDDMATSREAFRAGNLALMAQKIANVIEGDPADRDGLRGLVEGALKSGAAGDVIDALKAALESDPTYGIDMTTVTSYAKVGSPEHQSDIADILSQGYTRVETSDPSYYAVLETAYGPETLAKVKAGELPHPELFARPAN